MSTENIIQRKRKDLWHRTDRYFTVAEVFLTLKGSYKEPVSVLEPEYCRSDSIHGMCIVVIYIYMYKGSPYNRPRRPRG